MSNLVFFIGPPADASRDKEAVMKFISEKGKKIICGGTTTSIFTKYTGFKPEVNLSTACDNIPPFGKLGSMTATEGAITLKKLNACFNGIYSSKNAVGYLKRQINNADRIRLYIGQSVNPVNGTDKKSIVENLIMNIKDSGVIPEIVEY